MTVNHSTKPASLYSKQCDVAATLEVVMDLSAPPRRIMDAITRTSRAIQGFAYLLPSAFEAGTPVEDIVEGIVALLDDQSRDLRQNLIELYQYIDALEVEVVMLREELDAEERQSRREQALAEIVERVAPKAPVAPAPDRQETEALRDAVEKLTGDDAAPAKGKAVGHA